MGDAPALSGIAQQHTKGTDVPVKISRRASVLLAAVDKNRRSAVRAAVEHNPATRLQWIDRRHSAALPSSRGEHSHNERGQPRSLCSATASLSHVTNGTGSLYAMQRTRLQVDTFMALGRDAQQHRKQRRTVSSRARTQSAANKAIVPTDLATLLALQLVPQMRPVTRKPQ